MRHLVNRCGPDDRELSVLYKKSWFYFAFYFVYSKVFQRGKENIVHTPPPQVLGALLQEGPLQAKNLFEVSFHIFCILLCICLLVSILK